MDYLKIVEQLGKGFPYGLIDRSGTQRAADYHEDRFVGCEMAQFQCGKLISPGKLLPDGRTGKYRFSVGRERRVSGKLQHTLVQTGIHSLLARPGVMSDSWITQGIFREEAALTTGTVTKPPLEKTISGQISFRIFLASP